MSLGNLFSSKIHFKNRHNISSRKEFFSQLCKLLLTYVQILSYHWQCALPPGQTHNTPSHLVNNQYTQTSNLTLSLPTSGIFLFVQTTIYLMFSLFKFYHCSISKFIHISGFLIIWITEPDSSNISLMVSNAPVKNEQSWQNLR